MGRPPQRNSHISATAHGDNDLENKLKHGAACQLRDAFALVGNQRHADSKRTRRHSNTNGPPDATA